MSKNFHRDITIGTCSLLLIFNDQQMKSKKHITTFILILITLCSNAQGVSDVEKRALNPVTPITYQFMKFGEMPVSEYTGIPEISIPLYTIEMPGVSLPLTLRYHSKGVRVAEEADWVGLGWDLSFGSIAQIVNDKDDLSSLYTKSHLPYTLSRMPSQYNFIRTSPPTYTDMSIDNGTKSALCDNTYSFITIEDSRASVPNGWDVSSYLDFYNVGTTDYEKDIFSANVLGENLLIIMKFQNKTGFSRYSDTIISVLNKTGYKIKLRTPIPSTKTWMITTPQGISCFFEEVNYNYASSFSNSFSYSVANSSLANKSDNQYSTAAKDLPPLVSRCWQITKIKSICGDSIIFNYSTKKFVITDNKTTTWKVGSTNRSIHDSNNPDGWGPGYDGGPYYGYIPDFMKSIDGTFPHDVDHYATSGTINFQEKSYVSSIQFSGNTLNFFTSPRTDLINTARLDSIQIINSLNSRVKSIGFQYDYFNSELSGCGYITIKPSQITKRLKLSSMSTQKDEIYRFSYNSTLLPPKNSFAVDFWGYYNGCITNQTPFPNVIDFKDQYTYDKTKQDLYNSKSSKLYAVDNYCKAGILEKIQYPTGGYCNFYFSLNCFDNYKVPNDPNKTNTSLYWGNGLKIDSIVHTDASNHIVNRKYYQYDGGKLQTPLHFFYSKSESYWEYDTQFAKNYNGTIYSTLSTNSFQPNPTGSGTGVGYSKVKISNLSSTNSGSSTKFYSNQPDITCSISQGDLVESVPSYHKGLDNGTLIREEIRDNNNLLLGANRYSYSLVTPATIEYNARITNKGRYYIGIGYLDKSHDEMMVSYYPLYKPQTMLTTKYNVSYKNNDSLTVEEYFTYNVNNLLNFKGSSTSFVSQSNSESYLYPGDILNNSKYDQAEKDLMTKLIENNRLSDVIETQSTRVTRGVLSTKITHKGYSPCSLLPIEYKSGINNGTLQTDITYTYNSSKKIIQSTDKSNLQTVFLWGYNSQNLVAIIKNASYSQVTSALGVDPETLSASPSPDMTKIDVLRRLLPNAQVTTYTYTPLIGITSVTDPKGVKTTYEYDTYGRLKTTYDNSMQLIQTTNYNFGTTK